MPVSIRLFTFASFMLGLLLPLALLPGGRIEIDGWPVTQEEFWRSGAAATFCVVGGGGFVLFYGFVRARKWVRWLFPVFILGLGLTAEFRQPHLRSVDWFGLALVATIGSAWLFLHPPTRRYFLNQH